MGKWLILDYAMNRNYACWWVSPTYRMASQVWRDLKRMSRNFEQLTVSQNEMRIDAKKGGSIEIRSAHLPDVLRGAGLNFVVLDEAAFMPPEIWGEIVRPMLSDKSGGALFLSTPYGRNWFYDLYMAGRDRRQQEWRSFQYTSYQNPYIPREEIDSIRAATSSSVFRAEYMAEFLDDDGLVFRGIHAAATAPAHPRPLEGRLYVGGIDWGRSRDFTVITLIDAETRQVVAVERFNQVGWALQRGRIAALCALWKPAYLWAEENSIGAVNLEALQADGVPVRPFRPLPPVKRR
ncbi:MAG: Terminase-like family protein [Chloroflexi bacterium OLB15]|nr:MAG: Terminase-like family protein [Chloroflexi bacterium OLB15]